MSYGSTVNLALLSTAFNTADWSIVGTSDAALSVPTITPSGSPLGATATFTAGADPGDGLGISYLVQCKINGGRDSVGQVDSSLIKRAVVGVPNLFAIVPMPIGETLERSATHGWTRTINQALAAGGLMAGLGPYDDSIERNAAPITLLDTGKFAFQLSDGSLWVVGPVAGSSGTAVEWKSVSVGGSSAFDGNFGALLDSLCGAGTTVGYWRGDLGVHLTGSIANQWDNQISGGSAFGPVIERTAGVGIASVSAGVGGKVSLVSNGTTQGGAIVTIPYPLGAPATTQLHYYIVAKSAVGTPGTDGFLIGSSYGYSLYKLNGSANTLRSFNGAVQDATMVSGSWGRIRKSWTGSGSDILKWGSGADVVGSTGNSGGSVNPLSVFDNGGGAFGSIWDCALILMSRATLSNFTAAMSALDTAVTDYFGAGVQV